MRTSFDELMEALEEAHKKCPWVKEQTVEKTATGAGADS